jgi:type IV fimbrial biogenesis protein FimT
MVKRAHGFSLLELMAVLAIVGILMSIAVPAFSEWIASQRVRDTAADIHTSLMRARNEAISRGLNTSIKPVNGNWANGWFIANPDGTYNPDPANPTVFIEQHGPVQNATISGAGTGVAFTPVGRLSGTAIAIKITSAGTRTTRCVTVDTAGRPKTRPINATDTCS